jgi:hypothetical protein
MEGLPHDRHSDERMPRETPEARFDRLLIETEALADRLSTVGPSLDLKRLNEMTDRYSGFLLELGAAEDEWLLDAQSELSALSA